LAGVIERTGAKMIEAGSTDIAAVIGACIGPECCEFGPGDLEPLVARYGSSLVSVTSSGLPALDLRAGVHRALEAASIRLVAELDSCTACDPGWFSWRARKDTGRQALVVASVS
jgi:hypothetical protein